MKFKIFWMIILLLLAIVINKVRSQEIQGKIFELDEHKHEVPIPGVNVYWSGTQTGTTTDPDGYFKLLLPDYENLQLVISFIGYKNDTITVTKNHIGYLKIILDKKHELEEVVIAQKAAGSHISRIDPVFTQNITGAELQKAACCNLSESFETNASVDVSYSDAISGAKQIQLLGIAGIYSQIMTENIPNLRGLAISYGLGYIPGTWMESIQISKGTSSVKNGYESISGQINVEYKKPDNGEIFYLNVYANSFGKIEGNANSSIKVNKHWNTAIFAHVENFQNKTDANNDSFLDQPLVKQYNFFNRWKYGNNKHIRGQIGIKILDEDRTGGQLDFNNSLPHDTSNAYGINVKTKRYEVFTKTAYLFNKPGTNIAFINSFIYHRQNSFFGLNDYDAKENNYYGNLMFQSYLGNTNHVFTTGISYLFDDFDENLNDSAFTRRESVPGGFFEYTYKNHDKFTLILGLRADFHNIYGTIITPRLHMKYNVNEHTIFRASAGKGYRTPNIIAENNFLLASSRKLIIKNELKMEEAWNYGVNLTKYFNIFGREISLNAEYYRTDFINQAIIDRDQDISKIIIYNLDGKSYSNSFQIEAVYELFKGLDLVAAFRYNDVKMTINEKLLTKPLVNIYKGLINLSYISNLKKWQFDFTAQFNGESRLPNTDGNSEEYKMATKSSKYTLINAQVTKFFRKWEIYIGGENLTNFKQENPIIGADDPFGKFFDSSMVWGPITGIKIYTGFRYYIKH